MESTAATVVSLLTRLGVERKSDRIIATGGGARNEVWLKLIADMTGMPVFAPESPEPGCRGAAMLAAVAAGWYKQLAEVAEAWAITGQKFDPDPSGHSYYREWFSIYQQITGSNLMN